MKKSKLKRLTRLAQIKEWEKSGLRKEDYCKKIDITKDSFSYWHKQYLAEANKEGDSTKMVESNMKLESAPIEGAFISIGKLSLEKGGYEIEFPNGLVLKTVGEINLSLLKMMKDA